MGGYEFSVLNCVIQHVSSCITAGSQEGLELHPTFTQKSEGKIPFGRPSPRCSWEEINKN